MQPSLLIRCKVAKLLFGAGLLIFFSACDEAGVKIVRSLAENKNYDIEGVDISGPDFPPGRYRIDFTIVTRDSSGGTVLPIVSLIDQDGGLRFGDDLLSQEQFTYSVGLTPDSHHQFAHLELGCSGSLNVVGSPVTRDSGEGKKFFLGFVDSADVYARVQRADGTGSKRSEKMISVDCQR